MSRYPSGAALTQAAGGDWTTKAACRNQPDFTDQDPDVISSACSRCRVAAECISAHQDVLDFTEATA